MIHAMSKKMWKYDPTKKSTLVIWVGLYAIAHDSCRDLRPRMTKGCHDYPLRNMGLGKLEILRYVFFFS